MKPEIKTFEFKADDVDSAGTIRGYASTFGNIDLGFDIVAQYFMREVSVFDMMYNVPVDSYEYFARDTDVADASASLDGVVTAKPTSIVFLTKTDMESGSMTNEDFLLKFKSVTSQTKFVTLKAVLNTLDTEVAPYLDSYRMKVSS